MNCACHGEPMYWQKDRRPGSGGGAWRCAVKKRAANQRLHAKHAAARNAKEQERYHRDGWAKKRRRELAAQRASIVERLGQLDREATEC